MAVLTSVIETIAHLPIPESSDEGSDQGRYHRQTLIPWWDQRRVADARVLVVGAGALGNEVAKLLALTGVGHTLIYDFDKVERSNLSRSVLLREADEGCPKVEAVARRMRELNPEVEVSARAENIVTHGGLGVFAWADVVIGAVDNREARVFVNGASARAGKRWVDGAIEGLSGIVRAFDPASSACYECTMNATDRRLLAERRSCALLARDVRARGHVPSTAISASIIAAFEVQEAMKMLHDQPALIGEGLHVHGLFGDVSRVRYPRREDCPGHEQLGPIERLGLGSGDVTIGELLARAEATLGEGAVLDLSRDVILRLDCPACGHGSPGRVVLGALTERGAACPACGAHRVVEIAASIGRDTAIDLASTPKDLGLPPFDVITARRGLEPSVAWLFDGDAPLVLGPLTASWEAKP